MSKYFIFSLCARLPFVAIYCLRGGFLYPLPYLAVCSLGPAICIRLSARYSPSSAVIRFWSPFWKPFCGSFMMGA